ncbi:hypothetical protein EMCRGX_G014600 [Ephydatia muelleri]
MDIPEQDTNEPDMNEQYPETVAEHQVVENTELPEPVAEHPIVEDTPSLTWRDTQYLIMYTANPNILSSAGWKTNGAGRQFHLNFGFGAIDTEAMVTRAKH